MTDGDAFRAPSHFRPVHFCTVIVFAQIKHMYLYFKTFIKFLFILQGTGSFIIYTQNLLFLTNFWYIAAVEIMTPSHKQCNIDECDNTLNVR